MQRFRGWEWESYGDAFVKGLAWVNSTRRFVVTSTVLPWVASCSRSRPPAKLRYEPRVDILRHGYEYAPLNTACWPDWLHTEIRFSPQNVALKPRSSLLASFAHAMARTTWVHNITSVTLWTLQLFLFSVNVLYNLRCHH